VAPDAQGRHSGVSRRGGFTVTTERDRKQRPAPDLVNRQFRADACDQLWVADVTYIPTWTGFLYLAVVIDAFSRKVVGWSTGERMTADLTLARRGRLPRRGLEGSPLLGRGLHHGGGMPREAVVGDEIRRTDPLPSG
jgi:transposase InsO family protein